MSAGELPRLHEAIRHAVQYITRISHNPAEAGVVRPWPPAAPPYPALLGTCLGSTYAGPG